MASDEGKQTDSRHASEYLANERTFLAWIRTSIAVVSLGFVVARFSLWLDELAVRTGSQTQPKSTGTSLHIGLGMMAFGAVLAGLAVRRYHTTNRAIREGRVGADSTLVALVAAAVILLAGAMIVYMLLSPVQPT